MRPREFYDYGLTLAQSAQTEAQQRTAVSRLYYGLHHEGCCRYFRRNPWAQLIPVQQRHRELPERFIATPHIPESFRIGNLLRDLFRMRAECDYEIVPPLRFQRRSYSVSDVLSIAVNKAEALWAALELYSPGDSPDGCICNVAR